MLGSYEGRSLSAVASFSASCKHFDMAHAFLPRPMEETAELVELPHQRATSPRAFEELYLERYGELCSSLWLVTRNRFEAEEIAQEAFLRLLERWDAVARLDDPAGYLYRTAVNVWRSRGRRASLALRKLVHTAPAPADEIVVAESRLDVIRVLGTLTPRQRAAVVLTDLVGLTSEEAATALGVRASTVRVLASRGRAALKEGMQP
jgi:RNA polymerase sigma-70 factor (ECF subfamily)